MTEKQEARPQQEILTIRDFKGFFHNHILWPEPYPEGSNSPTDDGVHSIEELTKLFAKNGYRYFGISPHNYPTPKDVKRLRAEVTKINEQDLGIHLFLGIEANITHQGELAFPPEILRPLDYIIGSLHFWDGRQQNRQESTKAVVEAIKSGWVDIAGHLSHATYAFGVRREPMDIDFETVCQVAKEKEVVVEISLKRFAIPQMAAIERQRQLLIAQAIEHQLLVTFDYDLHTIKGDFQRDRLPRQVSTFVNFGGKKENVLNTWPIKKIHSWLEFRKSQR